MIPVDFHYTVFNMLRVLLLILAVVIIWILFFSGFEKRTRIIASVSLFVVSVFALWFDSYLSNPRSDKIAAQSITVCDLDVRYSYRTNYEVRLCVQNDDPAVTLRRVEFEITAQVCDSDEQCTRLQSVSKSRPVVIAPGASAVLEDSIRFDAVAQFADSESAQIEWQAAILGVKGS